MLDFHPRLLVLVLLFLQNIHRRVKLCLKFGEHVFLADYVLLEVGDGRVLLLELFIAKDDDLAELCDLRL